MGQEQELELIKRQLEEELGQMHFIREEEVVQRTHPRSWSERLRSLWNKEIEVPLVPIGMSFAVLFSIIAIVQFKDIKGMGDTPSPDERQLIEVGGNTYWEDEYAKVVAAIEGDDKS